MADVTEEREASAVRRDLAVVAGAVAAGFLLLEVLRAWLPSLLVILGESMDAGPVRLAIAALGALALAPLLATALGPLPHASSGCSARRCCSAAAPRCCSSTADARSSS